MAGLPTTEQIAERLGARKTEAKTEPVKETPVEKTPVAEKPEIKPAKKEPAKAEAKPEVKTEAKPEAKPEFSVESFNKVYGTQFKSDEELKSVLEHSKQFQEIKPKYDDLDKRYKDLELKAKLDPFADDFVKGLNELKKNGANQDQIQAYVRINSLEIDKLDIKEKAILQYQLKEGLTEEKARLAFADDYAINESDYDVDMDDDVAVAKMKKQIEKENRRLERDAKGIDSFLSEYKKKVSTAEKPEDTFKKEWSKYEPQVKEIAPVIADNYAGLKGIPLEVVKDGEPTKFDFEVPDDFKKAIPGLVSDFLTQEFAAGRPVQMNKEGISQINSHLDRVLKAHFFDKYVLDASIHMASKVREEMANKFSNSGKPHKGDMKPLEGEAQDSLSKYKRQKLNGVF